MQLPRVVIAAVFFVIGALLAIPLIWDAWFAPEANSATRSATTSPTPTTPTPTGPTPTRTGQSPSPTPTPTRASPTRSSSPSPTPTRTTTRPPAQPLRVTIGSVQCPGRTVRVTVHNTGSATEDYAIEKNDDSGAAPGRIERGATRTSTVTLREDRRTRIQVTWKNVPVRSRTLTADCRKASPAPAPTGEDQLPRTGSDSTVLWARGATGAAAMVTGVIIFWYGGIWPRRREQVFARKGAD